jgi:hypothetical protein
MKQMLRRQNSAAMFLTHISPDSLLDGFASSRRIRIEIEIVQAPASLKALKWLT